MARTSSDEIGCVILCGGGGTRMGSGATQKVCSPVGGVPAVVRTVEMLRGRGIGRIVVVVGAMAGQVVETVGERFCDVVFAYQHEQLGTGHAAQIGVAALKRFGHDAPVLITLGDKIIEPWVVDRLRDTFLRSRADLVFATLPKRANDTSGRVFVDARGRVVANIEFRDLQRARLMAHLAKLAESGRSLTGRGLLEIGLGYVRPVEKLSKAAGPVFKLMQTDRKLGPDDLASALGDERGLFEFDGKRYTAEQIEQASKTVNVSVYLFAAQPLYEALARLDNDNAQREYYLPDIIRLLASGAEGGDKRRHRVRQMVVDDETAVLAFNSPDELLAVEAHIRRKEQTRQGRVRPPR